MSTFVLRRFVGFTPYNAVDRISDRKEAKRPVPLRPCARWFYYGALTWRDLFLATSVFRGRAYRAGDATRRQRRAW